ncbi:MAG TPA: AI-2E family transporter [Myxococcales bacterium]|nr:AI-2E family transporter [Myxococcales bacterium]
MNEHAPAPRNAFVRRVVTAVGIATLVAALVLVLWFAVDLLLLVFTGILGAVLLRALSDPLARHTGLKPRWSLTLVVALLLAIAAIGAWLLTPTFAGQLADLAKTLPDSLAQLRSSLSASALGRLIVRTVERAVNRPPDLESLQELLTGAAGSLLRWAVYALTIVFVALFIAYEPRLYVEGVVRLLPVPRRPRAREVLDAMGHALRWFLIGRAAGMLLVGVLTALELWLLGIPLALLLGILVALLTFVPYVGPILGGVLIGFVTLVQAPGRLLLVLGIYTVIQYLDDYLVMPLVQERTVSLAPALTLAAEVLMGLLFGALGVAISTPLAAAGLVFVRMVYVEDTLGDREHEVRKPP